jgi:hypothetical protein
MAPLLSEDNLSSNTLIPYSSGEGVVKEITLLLR